jgi:hypothetical protein
MLYSSEEKDLLLEEKISISGRLRTKVIPEVVFRMFVISFGHSEMA